MAGKYYRYQLRLADKLTLDRQAMKNRSTAHLRIYVGSIPDNTTVEDVYEHFISYGEIHGIVTNRNFGFVQFAEESSAREAIAKANGSTLHGNRIVVKTAQSNPEKRLPVETTIIQPSVPPAVALSNNLPAEEVTEDLYDNHGNYIGDQGGYAEEELEETRESYPSHRPEGRSGLRGRGAPRARGRGGRVRGGPPRSDYTERPPGPARGEWADRGGGYDRYTQQEYPRALPVPERNDCEIIVVSKGLTEYAEYIEERLKRLGIVVDLLFPMEDVPIGKVLGNIASRGCLYAILVMPQNQENRSLTLTILHGLPQEHRNMPLEDALHLLSRNFQEVQRGGPTGREAVYALLGQLADGRTLTVLQYEKVIEYLQERKEQQEKLELGEPRNPPANNKAQVDLQQRILSILNDKNVTTTNAPPPVTPVPPPVATQPPTQTKLLNDPTVRKALDSILQKFT